jgi:DNA-binding MarR family transcriptional regulator
MTASEQGETSRYSELFGSLNFAIIRLGRAHRSLASQLMGEVGLRPEQGAMMMHLWSVGPVRQTSLAAQFSKDSAATTRTVQRMERAGYVRRRPDPTDKRATLVEVTAAGNALRPRVEELWRSLERDALDHLPEAERQQALELVISLGDALSAKLTELPHPVLAEI